MKRETAAGNLLITSKIAFDPGRWRGCERSRTRETGERNLIRPTRNRFRLSRPVRGTETEDLERLAFYIKILSPMSIRYPSSRLSAPLFCNAFTNIYHWDNSLPRSCALYVCAITENPAENSFPAARFQSRWLTYTNSDCLPPRLGVRCLRNFWWFRSGSFDGDVIFI